MGRRKSEGLENGLRGVVRDDRLSFLLEMATVPLFIDGDLSGKRLFWVGREMSTLVTLFLQFFFSDTFDGKS